MPEAPLVKLVIEIRFKASLDFYGKMDPIGISLADEFPDWERSPLTLEIRNKKKHRRLFLSTKRAFYEVDVPNTQAEFSFVQKTLEAVVSKLSPADLERVGIRQWFAVDLQKSFALMVDQFAERFLARNEQLSGILTDKTYDVGYLVDNETADGWKYHLRMGPMEKSQWFGVVPYEMDIFEAPIEGDNDAATFAKLRAGLPDQFLYIDIDSFREEYPPQKLGEFLTEVRRRTHDLASKLTAYCKG